MEAMLLLIPPALLAMFILEKWLLGGGEKE
jgi:hypothetical protein